MIPTALYRTRIEHHRGSPIRHSFGYPSISWLVDLEPLGRSRRPPDLPAWLAPIVSFRAADHLGDPENTWYDNVLAFAQSHQVDLTGCRVLALTNARSLGYVFNPLTLYWCLDGGDQVRTVIAEVHNTYGERHCYLLRPDTRGRAEVDKAFYVSPFNDTHGRYTMQVPRPQERLDVRMSLHRQEQAPFVATWRGSRVPAGSRTRVLMRHGVLAAALVAVRIRVQGVRLWARRLPIVPRPVHPPQESV